MCNTELLQELDNRAVWVIEAINLSKEKEVVVYREIVVGVRNFG